MKFFLFLRSVYRRLVGLPYIGTVARKLKEPVKTYITKRYKKKNSTNNNYLDMITHAVESLRNGLINNEQAIDHLNTAMNDQHEFTANQDRRLDMITNVIDALQGKLNGVTSNQLDRQEADVIRDELFQRLEFVRAETLFAVQNQSHKAYMFDHTSSELDPKVKNNQKLETMSQAKEIKINIGCGHVFLNDYLNVDFRELPGVDIIADLGKIPFAENTIAEIYSSHVLEHFPKQTLLNSLMPYWISLLRPEGIFRAVVPDTEAMIAAFANKKMSFEDLREVTFGLQEYEGDFHYNMFSKQSLIDLLTQYGLSNIAFTFTDRKNGKCFDMEIYGTKKII